MTGTTFTSRYAWNVDADIGVTKFTYKNAGTPTPFISGINKASIGLVTRTPGLIKFTIKGKTGSYGPIVAGDLPLKATLILDLPPHSATNQCGETNFATGNCLRLSAGNTVKCQLQ